MKASLKLRIAAAIFGACTVLTAADARRGLGGIEPAEAASEAAALRQDGASAAMWIWSDKYVYRPGETLTLRGTLKPNGDLYPYTILAYRLNNQTGVRTFLPAGNATPTDIYGNTVAQGFRITRLPEWNKQVLVGANGAVVGAPLTIPDEAGMHTIVVQLRDYTGTRVMKTAYQKIGVVSAIENLTGNIDGDRTLVNTRAYNLSGVVLVRNGVLRIEPGTFIVGQPGSQPPSVLVVTKTARIEANGTRSRPIIMTSSQPFGQRKRGDWGGLILLGTARGNMPAERQFIEGLTQSEDTRFGGDNDSHNCGTLRYVRVEYAGAELAPNNEVNGITWGGCGSATITENVQSHYGFDDAFEWFGGNNDASNLVATYAGDDNIDVQLGYRGRIQNVIILQNAERGNRGIEADNSEFNNTATPLGTAEMWNFTMVGSGLPGLDESNSPGIFLRRGAAGTLNNMIVMNFSSLGAQFTDAATLANIDTNALTANGILLWNNGRATSAANTVDAQVHTDIRTFAAGTRGQGRNFVSVDPMLRRPFEFSDPDFRPLPGSPVYDATWVVAPDNGFYDQSANYIGAMGDIDWTEEWSNFLQEADLRQ